MKFQAVIGLEIHAQISAKTKMFCRCSSDSFSRTPNSNVCPVCMGFPGQLPVLNKNVIEKAIVAAMALNCKISTNSKFDRKNYFYPDNPKGFQISQYDEPLSKNGYVDVLILDDSGSSVANKKVRINRLHIEDDAGKLMHISNGTLLDFNRSGCPLMEIVSEPDMNSAIEAKFYAREIQKILRYVGSSEADMEKGMMRFDASVSIREEGDKSLNPRAEIKNLNSFKSLENAINYEFERQVALWNDGKPLRSPVTLGWNDEKGETYFMRDKEESDDYRYFPEPDLPPLKFEEGFLDGFVVPRLPKEKKQFYMDTYKISEDDARILSDSRSLSEYFEKVVELTGDPKMAVSFINTVLMMYLKEDFVDIENQKVTPELLSKLIILIKENKISKNIAKGDVFKEMYASGKDPNVIIEEKGLKSVDDSNLIEEICKKVLSDNPKSVEDIKNGKLKALSFLVGMVMKESKGQANALIVQEILKKILEV